MLHNITVNDSNTQWIQPRLPGGRVRGFFSCRSGGISKPPFASLNVGLHVKDDANDVLENRRIVSSVLGCALEEWVVAEQVHGSQVEVVGHEHCGRGALSHNGSVRGVDALITNQTGLTLVVMAADCVPVLFVDPAHGVVGVAHSGWKGTVGHIASRVLQQMSAHYGSMPTDVHVVLGPSIRRCCYEVDGRVAAQVAEEFGERFFLPRFAKPQKYLLSLQACIYADLVADGVQPGNIQDVGFCTSCRSDLFYSHRKENGRTGRHLGAIRIESGA